MLHLSLDRLNRFVIILLLYMIGFACIYFFHLCIRLNANMKVKTFFFTKSKRKTKLIYKSNFAYIIPIIHLIINYKLSNEEL